MRSARSGAPWVRKCGKLPIRENLATHDRTPTDRLTVRPHNRHTNAKYRVVCGEGFFWHENEWQPAFCEA